MHPYRTSKCLPIHQQMHLCLSPFLTHLICLLDINHFSAYSCIFPLYGLASNMGSHNHVIGLVGSAFNEGVVLDIDHR